MISRIKKPHSREQTVKILCPLFKKWFFSAFKDFTEPQKYSIYTIHARENILVSSPTGSGKTMSAFGAILNELVDLEEKNKLEQRIYAVYISPLKALSNDIEKNLKIPLEQMQELAGRELNIKVGVRTGDTTPYQKQKLAKNPPHILITTPESLAIMLSSPKFRENFHGVDWAIIDEVHALAENKRGTHLSLSLERLQKLSPGITRVGLSATVAPLEDVAHYLVGNNRPCNIVDVQFIKEYDFEVISPVPDLINVTQQDLHNNLYNTIHDLVQEHKTTLIFTNTRSATERIVHYMRDKFPKSYTAIGDGEDETNASNKINKTIGAHHGSLSKQHRHKLENDLKQGKLKCVVCSTSLELGIDIGYVDLVICLGSPKSVARLLQRAGRAGHSVGKVTKARIIVLDRDDLVECSVMLKAAMDKKIDRIHIPTNCLDVLAQHIVGMTSAEEWDEQTLWKTIKQAYPYKDLKRKDYNQILQYLAGDFVSLEQKHVYAKIRRQDGKITRRGRMTRVIYMTNIGTIPDETSIKVKIGDVFIGTIEESFLERLKPGDIFVLGGEVYEFRFAKGTTVQVKPVGSRPPTVPSWFSEQLPLSFDLASAIGRFRRLMQEQFEQAKSKTDVMDFINNHLTVDEKAANAIYNYMNEQYEFCNTLPNDRLILIEHYHHEEEKKIVFHTLYGRRINDCLSRALAFSINLTQKRDVEVGISDNGFYISYPKPVDVLDTFKQITPDNLDQILKHALEKSEVLRRRFRHVAGRALMILRNYMGNQRNVGRQQMSALVLMKALNDIDPNFSILKEARREVLEDLMDIEHTRQIIQDIQDKQIRIEEIETKIPTPFAFNLVLQGHMDILKMEDKVEFLRRMHAMVQAKNKQTKNHVSIKKKLLEDSKKIVDLQGTLEHQMMEHFQKYKREEEDLHEVQKRLLLKARKLRRIPLSHRKELIAIIKGKRIEDALPGFIQSVHDNREQIVKEWPRELAGMMIEAITKREHFFIEDFCNRVENDPETQTALDKEELIENIKLVARRQKLEDDLKYDLIAMIDDKEPQRETKEWINTFVKGTIPKYCTDALYWYLRQHR